jgi:hypothetical protein
MYRPVISALLPSLPIYNNPPLANTRVAPSGRPPSQPNFRPRNNELNPAAVLPFGNQVHCHAFPPLHPPPFQGTLRPRSPQLVPRRPFAPVVQDQHPSFILGPPPYQGNFRPRSSQPVPQQPFAPVVQDRQSSFILHPPPYQGILHPRSSQPVPQQPFAPVVQDQQPSFATKRVSTKAQKSKRSQPASDNKGTKKRRSSSEWK